MSDSPAALLIDENGVYTAVEDGVAIPAGTKGYLIVGTDGTNARVVKVTSSRRLVVDGSEVTQPISAASLPLPTGAATEATLASIKDTDGVKKITDPLPAGSNLIGRFHLRSPNDLVNLGDATNPVRTDPTGTTAQPISASSLPLPTGAATETSLVAQSATDNGTFSDGTSRVVPAGFVFDEVAGTALTENDVAAARIDDKRAQIYVIEDAATRGRRLTITAANAAKVDGSAVTQPISAVSLPLPTGASTEATLAAFKAAFDSRDLATQTTLAALLSAFNAEDFATQTTLAAAKAVLDTIYARQADKSQFSQITDGTNGPVASAVTHPGATDRALVVRGLEVTRPSYYAVFDRIAPAANKYMATLFNTSSTRKVVVQRVLRYSWRKAAQAGNYDTSPEQYLARITARTAGTTVTIRADDTSDTLSTGISADTNSTAVTEAHIIRRFFAWLEPLSFTDAVPGNHMGLAPENYGLVWERKPGTRGLVLRQNQGITVCNVTSVTQSDVSYVFEFTDEVA